MNIPFGAKDGHQEQKKTIRKFNHLPPILGVKWGGGIQNVEKNANNVNKNE
jgi:hypothetical protein